MKQIIKYFTPDGEFNFLEKQRTSAFVVIAILGLIIAFIRAAESVASQSDSYFLEILTVGMLGTFMALNLFILKYTNIKLTGNIFSVGMVVLVAISLSIFDEKLSILYKYLGNFYTILGMFTISVMFASRLVLMINGVIIISVATRVYLYAVEHNPEQVDLLTTGFTEYVIAVVIMTLLLYFTLKFAEDAIDDAKSEAKIKDAQNQALLKMVEGIRDSSEQIYKASGQLSSNSQQISQNANEQAATTEEISASMEQMLDIINLNTQNAEESGTTTSKSAVQIEESSKAFLETIKAIADISSKTKIITEISEKTDILSINASIEASRAGEFGRGFAVVAQEIRKLADKTKMASDEIIELSASGQSISKVAGDKLEKLIPEIVKSAELVKVVVTASKDQQSGIGAITTSIQQLTEITNFNSGSAEEMSASAEELAAQAEQLKDLIVKFKAKE
ncbi:MAG: hypothetical protein KAI79_02235 [Bacteroidales bacterium]|nr:hypothetical protein [Bacteroidales bacterium]